MIRFFNFCSHVIFLCSVLFVQEVLRKLEQSHYTSILTALDEFFPCYFDMFWEWQESFIWINDLCIFDENFKVWLRHLNPGTCSESSQKTTSKHFYVPRSPTDGFFGPFAGCGEKIITEWGFNNEWPCQCKLAAFDVGSFILENKIPPMTIQNSMLKILQWERLENLSWRNLESHNKTQV